MKEGESYISWLSLLATHSFSSALLKLTSPTVRFRLASTMVAKAVESRIRRMFFPFQILPLSAAFLTMMIAALNKVSRMQNNMFGTTNLRLFLFLALTVLFMLDAVTAAYKKPPFNGSIFGKRANGITDYDVAGRTLASLCEIASEACIAWFPAESSTK